MEHLIFHLIVEAIQAIDRKLQQPLGKAVPELARLRAEPAEFLRQSPVTFGPRKRQVLATVIGLVVGITVVIVLMYILGKFPKPKQPDPWRAVGLLVCFAVVTLVARSVSLRLLQGGSVTLRPQGAEFNQGESSLFLPWDLFYTAGAMFQADHKSVVLPINPMVPVALGDSEGKVQAVLADELDTPFFQCSDGQLALKDLYEVRLTEFGALLFELGQRLGVARTAIELARAEVPPLAVPDEKGWLRIHLTQLPFPPICSGCGEHTPETMPLTVSAQNRTMELALPFCRACSTLRKRSKWLAFAFGASIGAFAGFAIPLAVVPMPPRKPLMFVIMGLVIAVGVGLIAVLLASLVVRDRHMPVRWKEYRPDKATVKLRFRRPRQAANLMEAMGLATQSVLVEARG